MVRQVHSRQTLPICLHMHTLLLCIHMHKRQYSKRCTLETDSSSNTVLNDLLWKYLSCGGREVMWLCARSNSVRYVMHRTCSKREREREREREKERERLNTAVCIGDSLSVSLSLPPSLSLSLPLSLYIYIYSHICDSVRYIVRSTCSTYSFPHVY